MAYSYSMQPSRTSSSSTSSSSGNGYQVMQNALDVNWAGYVPQDPFGSAQGQQYYDFLESADVSYGPMYDSPTDLSWGVIENCESSYATSQSDTATSPSTSNYTSRNSVIANEEPLAACRERRRKIQNRNSQRAFRERARDKEATMKMRVAELQAEISRLQRKERSQSETVEALQREISRLKQEWWGMMAGNKA